MSTATPPKPLTDPVLTTARMQADAQHPKGFIRTTKKDSKGNDIKSVGYVTGSNLQLGLAIEVQ